MHPILCCLVVLLTTLTTTTAQTDLSKNWMELSFDELDSLYLLHANSDFQEALGIAQFIAEKAKKEKGPKDTLYARTLGEVGMQYYYLGNYQKTIEYWTQSKAIYCETLGEEHRKSINTLGDVALLHYYLGNYQKSEELNLQVLAIRARTTGKKHYKYGMVLNSLGLNYWKTGRYEEAESAYLKSKQVLGQSSGKNEMSYANTISNLASLYYDMGRKAEVEPLYLQTKEITAQNLGIDHPNYASSINNLATLYDALGRGYEAEQLYLEAAEIRARVVGKEHPNYAKGLRNLAILYAKNKQYKKALNYYRSAQQILLKALGKEHPEYLPILVNIGNLYIEMGEYEKARTICIEAQKTIAKVLGKKSSEYREVLDKLANLYTRTKEYDKAWDICFHHIECNSKQENISREIDDAWAKKLLTFDYHSDQDLYSVLFFIYKILGRDSSRVSIDKQRVIASLALELLEKSRKELTGEEDQLRLLKTSAVWTGLVVKALADLKEERGGVAKELDASAFRYAELNKSVLLANAIQTERAYSFGDLPDSIMRQEKELQDVKGELKATLLEDLLEEKEYVLQEELSEINIELNRLKDNIEKKYPKYSQLKYQQSIASFKELQPLLDEKTAIIEYVMSELYVHVFYIDQTGLSMHRVRIDEKDFDQHIQDLHHSLSDYNFIVKEQKVAYQSFTTNAHWLYKQLLAPVLKDKKHIKDLVIITDGELGHLPFETFLVETAPQKRDYKGLHYLVKDYTISYAYSATLFVDAIESHNKKTDYGNHEMLAMAGTYNQKDSSLLEHLLPIYKTLRKQLKPIPNTQKEVEKLSDMFDGTFLWGAAANEQFFKEQAKDYSIIHLAMHGLLDNKSPIMSSLAFTENGDSSENNFLQAYEISKMDLNAALIVLSACETGYGEFEQGNGIASLARSFMYAGVPSMVVSLWQVNDQSTAIIMNEFYLNLKTGMNKAAALRQAKLKYLDRSEGIISHPAFWSPFVQIGAREPIQLSSPYGVAVFIGGFFVLLLGGIVVRKVVLS